MVQTPSSAAVSEIIGPAGSDMQMLPPTVAVFQILKRETSGDSRKRDRFAVSLGQLVGGTKIILADLVFRHTKPGVTKPVGMLLNGPGNLLGVAAFGPRREEREFFCFTERL